jgi:NhaP-type Na+/H+ or K+/H+ antiporter
LPHHSDTCCTGGKFAIKHVPTNLRHILSAESAANDGLAYPFLTLALYLTVDSTTKGAIGHWFVVGWLCKSTTPTHEWETGLLTKHPDQVILGTIIGAVIGLSFCHLMKFTHGKGYIDRESYVAQYLALTFLTMGICSTLGADDLLGAFAAGTYCT